jgi:hypothetical protein
MTAQGKKEAESLLLSLRAGGGTVLGGAFREALRLLQGVPVERKALLVLSDGIISDPKEPILALAATAGVEVSALALGPDADAAFLEALAQRGGGRFYRAATPQELPRLFLKEGQEVFQGERLEGRFPVEALSHPLTEGFAFPPLSVLLPARAEPWAQVVLKSGTGPSWPWGSGGRGGWPPWPPTSPAPGRAGRGPPPSWGAWPATWPGAEGAGPLRLPRGGGGAGGGPGAPRGSPGSGGREGGSPGAHGAPQVRGRLREEGVLLSGKLRLPLALPLPGEWTPRDGEGNLKALAEGSGGRLLTLEELPRRATTSLPLRPYLLALALVLFLLERVWEGRVGRVTFWEASQA